MTRRTRYLLFRYVLMPWKRRSIAREMGVCAYLPGAIPRAICRSGGMATMLAADAALFGGCLAAALLTDVLMPPSSIGHGLAGAALCVWCFCLCPDHAFRMLMKAAYIAATLLTGGVWAVAVFFLVLFEHVAALPAKGENHEGSVTRKGTV